MDLDFLCSLGFLLSMWTLIKLSYFYLIIVICVWTCMCIFMYVSLVRTYCHMHVEVREQSWMSDFIIYLCDTGSFIVCCWVCKASWPVRSWDFPSCLQSVEMRGSQTCFHIPRYLCPGDLNSGLHTWTANPAPTEPPLQPHTVVPILPNSLAEN